MRYFFKEKEKHGHENDTTKDIQMKEDSRHTWREVITDDFTNQKKKTG